MKQKETGTSARYLLVGIAVSLFATSAAAGDDSGNRVRIHGTSMGMFTQHDGLGLSQGRAISDVGINGTFEIMVGDSIRTGRYAFPHLLVVNLEFPSGGGPPIFLSGGVIGATAWFFDDGVICNGRLAGDFDETGFNLLTKGKLECTDGSRLKIRIQDIEVVPGVSVTSEIRGKLVPAGARDD